MIGDGDEWSCSVIGSAFTTTGGVGWSEGSMIDLILDEFGKPPNEYYMDLNYDQ
ncbi:hypothetical protein TSUD_127120 [Trifolium subterraneum]|nr:hypothetical protein TSUD_127120 [Trifolium subterraneum]